MGVTTGRHSTLPVGKAENRVLILFIYPTGTAIWVRGVLSIPHWRQSPNVTFTLDGVQRSLSSAISNDTYGLQYNLTFFQATGLGNAPHSLIIETHDSLLFTVSGRTYMPITLFSSVPPATA